jgi:hypothetical protein
MPDKAAKGFGISVSLDAAGAEGAEPCATQPPQTHTRLLPTRHSALLLITHTQPSCASILCRVTVRDGTRVWLFTESPCSIQVSLAPPPHLSSHVFPSGTVRRKRASLTRRGGCQ